MKTNQKVAAVIVNWNSGDLVASAVTSVIDDVSEVIVVDTASTDDSLTMLRRRFGSSSGIRLIELNENLGFAGATNAGTRLALDEEADLVLWLNSDATMLPGAVHELASFLESRSDAAAAAPAVLDPVSRSPQHTSCTLVDANSLKGHWETHGLDGPPLRSDWLSGEAILLRSSAVASIGLLSDTLFFWAEDLDWSLRATELGYELWCVPTAHCLHHVGGSSASDIRAYFAARNLLILLRTRRGLSRGGALRRGLPQIRYQLRRLAAHRQTRALRFLLLGLSDGLSRDFRRRFPQQDIQEPARRPECGS